MKCKVCGAEAPELFTLPVSKYANGPIVEGGPVAPYYRCTECGFLFSDYHAVYDEAYWQKLDPVFDGRVMETMRLYLWASDGRPMSVLDFGCGQGEFVRRAQSIGVEAYGTDINPPGEGFFKLEDAPLCDVVTACEVVEHFEDPVASFRLMLSKAKKYLAFQTAYYDPTVCTRSWWYLGPKNGHISLYSRKALDVMSRKFGIKEVLTWKGYPGVQLWKL